MSSVPDALSLCCVLIGGFGYNEFSGLRSLSDLSLRPAAVSLILWFFFLRILSSAVNISVENFEKLTSQHELQIYFLLFKNILIFTGHVRDEADVQPAM